MITPTLEGTIFRRLDRDGRVIRHRRMVILTTFRPPNDERLWCAGVSLPEDSTKHCRPFTVLAESLADPTRVEQTGERL